MVVTRRVRAPRLGPQARTWALTAGTAAVAAALYGLRVTHLPVPRHHLSTWWFVVLFAAAEVFVVHVQFQRDAHTVSLVEIPLVLGLFYADPTWLVPAHLIGAAVALGVYRRQRATKLVYNLAAFAVEDCLALLLFHAVARAQPGSPGSWLSAFGAAILAALLGVAAVAAVIAVSGGRQTWRDRGLALAFAMAATAITASTAVALAVLEYTDSRAVLLLAAPIAAIYVSNRLVLAQRNDRRGMELLHDSASALHGGDTATGLERILDQTRGLFQAGVAALIYVPDSDPATAASLVVGPGYEHTTLTTAPRSQVWGEWSPLVPHGRGALIGPRRGREGVRVSGVGVRDGMVAPLLVGSRVVGYLMVANRLSEVNRFSDADLLVLTTVAQQLSAAVEDGELEQPLHQLRVLERQVAYRESHDSLTGLAAAHAFTDAVEARLGGDAQATIATVVIDAAAVGGGQLGDATLLVVAERLRHVVRQEDLIGRIGPARFAVLTTGGGAEQRATDLRSRIDVTLQRPVHVEAHQVEIEVQIGVAVNVVSDSAESLLDRAYLAMVTV